MIVVAPTHHGAVLTRLAWLGDRFDLLWQHGANLILFRVLLQRCSCKSLPPRKSLVGTSHFINDLTTHDNPITPPSALVSSSHLETFYPLLHPVIPRSRTLEEIFSADPVTDKHGHLPYLRNARVAPCLEQWAVHEWMGVVPSPRYVAGSRLSPAMARKAKTASHAWSARAECRVAARYVVPCSDRCWAIGFAWESVANPLPPKRTIRLGTCRGRPPWVVGDRDGRPRNENLDPPRFRSLLRSTR